jgi:hypothetical protein
MNRKMTLLLLAAVTAILPAVAVADVLVTGTITLESYQHHTAFELQPGPNYGAANSTNSIGWIASTGNTMGTIDLQGSYYVQTEMVNVLDLNFTISNPAAPASFMGLYLNVSSSTFNSGTIMVISDYQLNFAALESTPVTSYSAGDPSIGLSVASPHTNAVAVDLSQNPHLLITSFVPAQTLYISFILPPGYYAGSSAMLTGQFVALA